MLTFSIVAGNDEKFFVIDSLTGKIFTAAVLDYEKRTHFDLLVQVSDGMNLSFFSQIIFKFIFFFVFVFFNQV